jgi:hypothetical protein
LRSCGGGELMNEQGFRLSLSPDLLLDPLVLVE